MGEEYDGASTKGHVDSVLWLWKVHNLVRERLTLDDDSVGLKAQWPSLQQCGMCYTETVRNSSAGPSTDQWEEGGWQQDFVFAYIQETFCAGSDTFVCAAFKEVAKN